MLRVVLLNSKIFNSFSHAFICLDKEDWDIHNSYYAKEKLLYLFSDKKYLTCSIVIKNTFFMSDYLWYTIEIISCRGRCKFSYLLKISI